MKMSDNICKLDLALLNGKVVTVNANDTIAEAVGVSDGRIVKVGSNEDVKKLIAEKTKVIDVGGRTVLPGMIDTHMHPAWGGTKFLEVNCRSPPIKSIKEILNKIRDKAQQSAPGKWIQASNYNENIQIVPFHFHPQLSA